MSPGPKPVAELVNCISRKERSVILYTIQGIHGMWRLGVVRVNPGFLEKKKTEEGQGENLAKK